MKIIRTKSCYYCQGYVFSQHDDFWHMSCCQYVGCCWVPKNCLQYCVAIAVTCAAKVLPSRMKTCLCKGSMHAFLICFINAHARQAQQAQLGTYWSNQLCSISLVLPNTEPHILNVVRGEICNKMSAKCLWAYPWPLCLVTAQTQSGKAIYPVICVLCPPCVCACYG